MKDKGPNDLEKKIYFLERANFRLTEENNILKEKCIKPIVFNFNLKSEK